MKHSKQVWFAVAGGAAGLVNGFFGGGGGMILVPMLAGKCGLDRRQAFATSVAVIAPLCALSAGIYCLRGDLELSAALPYLAGGLVGGLIGGRVFKQLSMKWLRRLFALLILYGGVRALL
ncbi:MAG: TSUP family transporter [Oscillospiraceae bacterium]|nr:TSUP family transporter [Oscillospiraceae bacterium]